MPKVGDIVFAKTFDVYTEETQVRPGIVTRVFTEEDGPWAKGREILSLSLFGGRNGVEDVDMDKGTTDDDGDWVSGGWADSPDGPSSANDAFATGGEGTDPNAPGVRTNADAVNTTLDNSRTTDTLGSVGASSDDPASNPQAVSGANTSTVADGSDAAPATQPV